MLFRLRLAQFYKQNFRPLCVALVLIVTLIFTIHPSVADILLHDKKAVLTDSEVGAVTQYTISFTTPEPSTYGSLKLEVCSNDPIPNAPCTAPNGFDWSTAVLSAQTGPSGFVILPGSTANSMVLGRVPAAEPIVSVSYTLDNVTNPSDPGTYFIRMQTFDTPDGTGTEVFEGGIALLTPIHIPVSATIPPYLTFCTGITITGLNCSTATGDYIDFGELSPSVTRSGTSKMLVFTNAQSGYNLSVVGTTMQSGNHEIKALENSDVSRPGTAQFGLNLVANSAPSVGGGPTGPGTATPVANYGTANKYRFVSGEILASTTGPDDVRQFTASYIVNVPSSQAPGIYVTTITYVCLATF